VQPSPAPVASPIQSNGFPNPSEVDILQEQLQSRDSKIMELEKEAALLRDQKTMIELEVGCLSSFLAQIEPFSSA
jgi:E3 ubiquitin-protein ligase BRE1